MKKIMVLLAVVLCACSTLSPQQKLQAQCDSVMAESLRQQMGCQSNGSERSQLFKQCQASCNGGVDREVVDLCLSRCDEFLEKQQQ